MVHKIIDKRFTFFMPSFSFLSITDDHSKGFWKSSKFLPEFSTVFLYNLESQGKSAMESSIDRVPYAAYGHTYLLYEHLDSREWRNASSRLSYVEKF